MALRPNLAALLCALLMAVLPPARGATLTVGRLEASLERLPFGQEMDAVVAWVRGRLEVAYAPRIAGALDRSDRDRLKAALEAELARTKDSFVAFDGRPTGYEVSVIDREFVAGAGEAVLVHQEGAAHHYLFLSDGKLWKYGTLLVADLPFEARVRELDKKLGAPASQVDAVAGHARWEGETLRVELLLHRKVYQGDLLSAVFLPLSAGVEERRKLAREKAAQAKTPNPDLEGILDDGQDDAPPPQKPRK